MASGTAVAAIATTGIHRHTQENHRLALVACDNQLLGTRGKHQRVCLTYPLQLSIGNILRQCMKCIKRRLISEGEEYDEDSVQCPLSKKAG